MRSFLLLASQGNLDRLSREGGLPDGLFCQAAADRAVRPDGDGVMIPCMETDEMMPPVGQDLQADVRRLWEDRLIGIAGYHVFHLLVAEGIPDSMVQFVNEQAKRIAMLRAGLADHANHYDNQVRHSLIIVFTGEPSAACADAINALVKGKGNDRPFTSVYLMMNQLEAVRQPDGTFQALHSFHLWPVAVSRLLYVLSISEDVEPDRPTTQCFAWQTFWLEPPFAAADLEGKCADSMRSFADRVLEGDASHLTLSEKSFSTTPTSLVQLPNAEPATWLQYDPVADLRRVSTESAHDRILRKEVASYCTTLNQEKMASEQGLSQCVSRAWGYVHGLPRRLVNARDIVRRELIRSGDDLDVGQSLAHWEEIAAADLDHAKAMTDAAECAAELRKVQHGFIRFLPRFVIVVSVSAFVGYLAMVLFDALTATWLMRGSIVAVCAVLGAFFGAFFDWDRERRDGQDAVNAYERKVREIGELSSRRYASRSAMVQHAAEHARVWRHGSVLRYLLATLDRFSRIVIKELTREALVAGDDDVPPITVTTKGGKPEEEQQRVRQLGAFRRASTPDTTETWTVMLPENWQDRLDAIVAAKAAQFQANTWQKVCSSDSATAGHIPVEPTIAIIRMVMAELRRALSNTLETMAIETLSRESHRAYAGHIDRMLGAQQRQLLSCQIRAEDIGGVLGLPILLLHPQVPSEPYSERLAARIHTNITQRAPLQDVPLIGIVFDRVPIAIAASADGRLVLRQSDAEQEQP